MTPLKSGTLCWLTKSSDGNEVPAGSIVEVLRHLGDLSRTVRRLGRDWVSEIVRDAYEVKSRPEVVMLAARHVLRPISDPDADLAEHDESLVADALG